MSSKIKKIVVVGGGSSGWMTAATLCTQLEGVEVSVIESPDHPIMGVGESTLGGIRHWTNLIGLKDKDFMPMVDGSYKLSIKFTDFEGPGTGSFHYPFGQPVMPVEGVTANDWWFLKGNNPSFFDKNSYARCHYPIAAVAENNRISIDSTGATPGFSFDLDSAYHFDATAFGQYLKTHICIEKGVNVIAATVDEVVTDPEVGVKSLKLNDGSTVTADLFVDCTGFKSLLLGDALETPFHSIENIIPNNRAWATHIPYKDKQEQLEPFTNCTALKNGWAWNIPLWSRIGAGYAYSDKYISSEDALTEFKKHIKKAYKINPESLEYRPLEMRNGIHEKLWVKNVVAIGPAAGFIEPLESTGLFTTHEFLIALALVLQRGVVNQWDRDSFSFSMTQVFHKLAQFVGMHYAISPRNDSDYWRDVTERVRIDNTLGNSISETVNPIPGVDVVGTSEFMHYANSLHLFHDFTAGTSGFPCIAAGMNYPPIDYLMHNTLGRIRGLDSEEHCHQLRNLYTDVQQKTSEYAGQCMHLEEYLRTTIHDAGVGMRYVGTVDELSDDDPRLPKDPDIINRVKGFRKTHDV